MSGNDEYTFNRETTPDTTPATDDTIAPRVEAVASQTADAVPAAENPSTLNAPTNATPSDAADKPRTDREAARALLESKKREQEAKKETKRLEKEERNAAKKNGAGDTAKRGKKNNTANSKAETGSASGSRLRLGRKTGDTAEVSTNRREIPVSGFDLLNGSFAATSRVRLISIIVVSVLLAVELLVGLRGVAAKIEQAGVQRSIAEAGAERDRVISAFGATTGIAGVTEVQIIDRERALSAALREAVLAQPDIVGLYNDLRRFDGLGVSVISVSAKRPETPRPAEGAEKPAAPATPAPVGAVVTIVAEGSDFGAIVSWTKRVQELPQLVGLTSTRQGLKVTVTAQFSPQYVAAAGADLLSALGVSLNATTAAAPTTTPGGP
jgi:hypothetical protein